VRASYRLKLWWGLDNLSRLSAVCALLLIAATLFAVSVLLEVF
jgi:hypothetical protein